MGFKDFSTVPRIFSRNDELVNLAIPVVAFFIILGEFLTGFSTLSGVEDNTLQFFTNVILLNSTHIAFTAALYFSVPQFSEVIKTHIAKVPYFFWLAATATVILFSVFFFSEVVSLNEIPSHPLGLIAVTIIIVTPAFHSLWQIKGLSLTYTKKIELRTRAKSSLSLERWEKWAFNLLLLLGLILVIFYLEDLHPVTPLIPLAIKYAMYLLCSLLVLLPIAKFGLNALNKSLFLSRVFLIPLSFQTPIAALALGATHGFEYLFVYRSIARNTQQEAKGILRIQKIGALAALAVLPVIVPSYLIWIFPKKFILLFASLTWTVTLWHYYFDRVIFRMRTPSTRERISPLLIGEQR